MITEFMVTNNTLDLQFELHIEQAIATLEYRWYKGNIALMHTLVPEPLRNKGAGSTLAKYALDYVRNEQLEILVYCPFVAKFIKQHPEYQDLMNKKYYQQGHA